MPRQPHTLDLDALADPFDDELTDDSPPDHGATDPDVTPIDLFMERMETARASRAKEIRAHLGLDASDIPDRLPEGFMQYDYVEGRRIPVNRQKSRRGRRKKHEA